ncbi:MAG: fumarate hydratase, partial [Anaerolineaceae bacterium]|nr:fumarate hydratase [Anaerolineaceae bacterium]
MKDLTPEILELIRRTSTDLPADIESRLREAQNNEAPDSAARKAMDTILANVEMTRRDSTPICQDTGTPLFFVKHPDGWKPRDIRNWIRAATAEATRLTYLRDNYQIGRA